MRTGEGRRAGRRELQGAKGKIQAKATGQRVKGRGKRRGARKRGRDGEREAVGRRRFVAWVMREEMVPRQYEKTTAPQAATRTQNIRSRCVTGIMSP